MANQSKMMQTMIKKLGSEEAVRAWYKALGAKGGRNGTDGGFAATKVGKDGLTGPERSRVAGQIGGKASVRQKAQTLAYKGKVITRRQFAEQQGIKYSTATKMVSRMIDSGELNVI